ncbi:OmpA family protein [Acidovorax sp. SUPP3334]|uniref:OmpA family protein n=1 Tax=Acidovorax sp. SUPP3334 TaxID=2920881 RepID=UPI0023DE1D55|nr:OmpA family protein [Acidovorax sp. SUPP3334]GKT23618.1 OmpA family protein [Acidovorax sp. SUPP3334]
MTSHSKLLGLLFSAALLGGCANTSGNADANAAAADAAAQAAPAPAPAPAAPAPAPEPEPLRIPEDGTVAEFSGLETELPADTPALLDILTADKNGTQRWEIKGYADRKAAKNAREIALARALAVRKELVSRGVPAKNLRVMFSTDQARNAVTVLPR